MKKIIYFLVAAFACSIMVSCETGTPYEKQLKKSIKTYYKKNLKDPGSLKDLELTYAILTQEEIDKSYDKAFKEWEHDTSKPRPRLEYASSQRAIVLAQYRAKNSFGAYIKGINAFIYYPFGDERLDLELLPQHYSYLLEAMLDSANKNVIK